MNTKIDIISGFLGAGKTTLIRKLLQESLAGTKVVLIENEFGEIGVDGSFLKDAGIEIKEINSGCICCSLVGDFTASLQEIMEKYAPERILIEPSGVGKLSDVQRAVYQVTGKNEISLGSSVAVVDATKCRLYLRNFGEFFIDQIAHAGTIFLSRTANMEAEKLKKVIDMIREHNTEAKIVTTPWEKLTGSYLLEQMEAVETLESSLLEEEKEKYQQEQKKHSEDENHAEGHCHEEHHHEEHHHEHGEGCKCGCHGHHHADDIFQSIGVETVQSYTEDDITRMLEALGEESRVGYVLRAKGMLSSNGDSWLAFDYTPGEIVIRKAEPEYTGKICVIGFDLKQDVVREVICGMEKIDCYE